MSQLWGYPVEMSLFLLILVQMGTDMLIRDPRSRVPVAVGVVGLGLTLLFSFTVRGSGPPLPDAFALFFQRLFLLVAIFVSVMADAHRDRLHRGLGDFQTLLLFATVGLLFVARAQDLLTLFVSIELLTITLFILVAYLEGDPRSAEAGMKYVVLGAIASALMLFGIAWLYGFSGGIRFDEVARAFADPGDARGGLLLGLAAVIAGLCFKIAAIPFPFWVPDVYEGAPTPITAFLTVASKGAGFAALLRVMGLVAGPLEAGTAGVLGLVAASTLFYGNLAAIPQRNIKRLLGYSSIGQAGFILLGVVAASPAGVRAVLFYFLAYGFSALGAFLAIVAFSAAGGSDDLDDYDGLHRRSPILALAIGISFLSLAGFPPLSGFFGKFLLLLALLDEPGWMALGAIAGANVIISLYYYLGVIRRVFVLPATDERPIPVARPLRVALVIAMLGTVLLGVVQGPFVAWAGRAAGTIY